MYQHKRLLNYAISLTHDGTTQCFTFFFSSHLDRRFSAGSAARGTSAVGYPASAGGAWSQTITGAEGGSANQWYVSGEECGNAPGNCGSACSNADASLHVSAIGGLCGIPDCGAAYDETGPANATNKRIESPSINTVGYASLTLDFSYIAAQGDDGFTAVYSCDGGTNWLTLGTPTGDLCCCLLPGFCGAPDPVSCSILFSGQGYWSTQSYALPVCAENIANLRIGFLWANNGNGVGTDPSVAIDDISITASATLPVELVNVSAKETRLGNEITWTTMSELNNSHFIVEHRLADGSFVSLGRIEGNGTTTSETHYTFTHVAFSVGDNYYRLKQVDFDGKFEYSQTLLVRNVLNEDKRLLLYPNPASSGITAQYFSVKDSEAHFVITDLSGRVILEMEQALMKGEDNYSIDVSTFEKGQYLFIVLEDGKRTVQSFVKN